MKLLTCIFILLVSSQAYAGETCDISGDPVDADTEESPLRDADYSKEKVIGALKGLEEFIINENQGKYNIPENYMTIVNGGYLLRVVELYKNKVDAENNKKYWEELYENAKKEYCQYRKTHFLIDW